MKSGLTDRPFIIDLLLFCVAIVWGLNFTVVKYSIAYFNPLSFNAFRFALAALFMWIIVLKRGETITIHKGDLLPLIGLSLLGQFLYQMVFITGIHLTLAANTSVMLSTSPIWVALFSHFFSDEKLTPNRIAGILLAFLGILFIISGGEKSFSISSHSVWGDLIVLLAALIFGIYTLLLKSMLKRYTPLHLNTLTLTFGGGALFLAGLPGIFSVPYSQVTLPAYLGIFYSGLLSIALAYMIWNKGLKSVGAIHTSAYQNLVPVFGLFFGVVLLKEKLHFIQYIGAICTIFGVILIRRK